MYSYQDIQALLGADVTLTGNLHYIRFDKARSLDEADEFSLAWFKGCEQGQVGKLAATNASTVVCSDKLQIPPELLTSQCFLQCADPKLLFSRLVNALLVEKQAPGIHPTAVISSSVEIGRGVTIGAHTIIDKCTIGDNCVIGCNCHLMDNTVIGNNVSIGSGTVVGGTGFGYSKRADGSLVQFPHIGGVRIGNNVEIGSNTSIDRGSLGDTMISDGVKIDNLVHIAHNVIIAKDALVIAHAMIGGSTRIGERSWIAPCACLKNGINIGDDVTVGLGAVVTKSIPNGETWVGNPAMPLSEFQKLRKKE